MNLRCSFPLLTLLPGMLMGGGRSEIPTFHEDIAPVVHARCTACHRPDGGAPFDLIDYRDVSRRALTILQVIEDGYMPPWHAVGGDVPLLDDRRLSKTEKDIFRTWVEAGKEEGFPKDESAPPEFPSGWILGEPDLVLEMSDGYHLPADGPDIYRSFVLPSSLKKTRYVKAIEFRPSSPEVVHHALFFADSKGNAKKLDDADPEPGFEEMIASRTRGRSLGGWVPGTRPRPLPDGLAYEMQAGSDLVIQTHFHLTGKPEMERSKIGLYFTKKPKARFTTIQLPPFFGAFSGIDLAPGEDNAEIRDEFELPVAVEAFGIQPHAHYRGKSLRLTAIQPDGSEKILLNIPEWDMDWQEEYRFAKPVHLSRGTRLLSEISWDNSEDSSDNPIVPPVRVRWGFESLDEMGSIDLFVVAKGKDGVSDAKALQTLQQAKREHFQWIAGGHLIGPDKLATFGEARDLAIRRWDEDGDGFLDADERKRARSVSGIDSLQSSSNR
ncbi:MAG: hypothetical protein AAGC68_05820 [Verrucomicrobiota bacterium]